MRTVWSCVAVVASVFIGQAWAADGGTPDQKPERKLITLTTKSPEARAALVEAWRRLDEKQSGAEELVKKAIAADPDFAMAHAVKGFLAPGDENAKTATRLAEKLPEAEKLAVEGLVAWSRGNIDRLSDVAKRLTEIAPDDFHTQFWAGLAAFLRKDLAAAESAFAKAIQLDPKTVVARRMLVSLLIEDHKPTEALAAAKELVGAAPESAVDMQLLGQAYLAHKLFKEAAGALERARRLDPPAGWVLDDLVIAKILLGDFAGAHSAIQKPTPFEAASVDPSVLAQLDIWVTLSEGKLADGLKAIERQDKVVGPQGGGDLIRAKALFGFGRFSESAKAAEGHLDSCATVQFNPVLGAISRDRCRFETFSLITAALLAAGDLEAAQKSLLALDEESQKLATDVAAKATVERLGAQAGALAKRDLKAAAAALDTCPVADFFCKLAHVRQHERAGDKAGASLARQDLLRQPIQSLDYAFVAQRVQQK